MQHFFAIIFSHRKQPSAFDLEFGTLFFGQSVPFLYRLEKTFAGLLGLAEILFELRRATIVVVLKNESAKHIYVRNVNKHNFVAKT